ncbi:type VII secretion-associated serine protease mycosin [Plantactinospora siamensis]|uniref:Type VII secretion-associated serine protease mycosin n=1 Tax=Plantactinospora siamensis TaxID=555372 RepID=A0ABV6NVR5_9ACTN
MPLPRATAPVLLTLALTGSGTALPAAAALPAAIPAAAALPATAAAAALPATAALPAGAAVRIRAAAPACGSPAVVPPPAPGTPWTQRRYPPEPLATLATGRGVTVAVIDSGVDGAHPQLAGRVLAGADFLDPGGDGRRDCTGHGTAVASIIAARPRAGTPLRGLAPDVRILPVRVSELQSVDGRESGRTASPERFAEAIRWSVEHGADVLNMSVVLYTDVPAVRRAVGYAVAHGAVVVAAAGNLHEAGDPRPYPAAYPGVIGVGAIGPDGRRAPYSQVGPYVDLVAPGSEVLAATTRHGTGRHDGTSYATPFVSATAALVRQYRPTLSAALVGERLRAAADPAPESGAGYGGGVLNPERAITERPADPRWTGAPAAALPEAGRPDADRAVRRDRARGRALLVSGIAALAALVAVGAAMVAPRGRRRRWAAPADRS